MPVGRAVNLMAIMLMLALPSLAAMPIEGRAHSWSTPPMGLESGLVWPRFRGKNSLNNVALNELALTLCCEAEREPSYAVDLP